MDYYHKEFECMPFAEKKELQSERLRDTVRNAYENVQPYRQKMDAINLKPEDIKGIEDIHKLPFTTKSDLRENYPFGMLAVPKSKIIRLHASSGTTGKLTVVGYTRKDIEIWAECCARALVSVGASKNSIVHVAYGYGLFTGGLGMHYGAEKLGAIAVPVSSGNTARQIQLIKDFESDVLCCTPSYAVYIAEEMNKMGISPQQLGLKYGVLGAEPWTNEMRKEIENKLHIKAFDIYGLSEISGPGVAIECAYQVGSHIQDDHFYPEIISEDTLEPLSYGNKGELVFTTLTKEGLPLIRYRTRDITALNNSQCRCGRTSVRIDRIAGRSDDMLIIRGVNVFPSQIESVIMKIKEVACHYHITVDRVNNLDTMQIDIELADDIAFDEVKRVEELKQRISQEIISSIGVFAKIKLVSSGSITRSEGKAIRVTDKRK